MLTEEISERVAKQLNLKKDLVDKIHRIQYKFLMENMKSDTLPDVQLMYIGKFIKNKYGHAKLRSNMGGLDKPSIQE